MAGMALDSTTVVTTLSFVALMSGVFLLFMGRRSDATAPAVLWAVSNLFLALGIALVLQQNTHELAFLCVIVSAALMWVSIANFNKRPVEPIWLMAGGVAWVFVSYGPLADFGFQAAAYMAVSAVYLLACTWELWRGRAEPLPARWPLLGLVLIYALTRAFGATLLIPYQAASEISAGGGLWPIYVASIIYIIGSTAFLMAMIKERTVAGHQHAAQIDSLTGIANRGAVMEAGSMAMAQAFARGKPLALAIFDLDRFKGVNDTFGHRTGDFVLRRFAEAANAGLRPSDLIGRIGGEEFLAVIPGAGAEAAVAIAERIRDIFAESAIWIDGKPAQATVSAGVAVGQPGDQIERLEGLLDRADRALYAAKAAGCDRVSLSVESEIADSTNVACLA